MLGGPARRSAAGFSLLEAMIALLVVGLLAAAAFALLNQSVKLTGRLADDALRGRAIAGALEWVQSANPLLQPRGEAQLDGCTISWSASAITPVTRAVAGPGARGDFDVALFDVEVRGVRASEPWFRFHVRQVGYRRAVSYEAGFPGR